jgi:hypothetical protein
MLIVRLWRSQPGKYFCISTKSANKEWKDTFFSKSQFGEIADFIETNRDKDIYFCPHGFSERRRKENCSVMPTLLWADLDEANPKEAAIKPTIAIESSPGRYVGLWVIDKPLPDKRINQRLSYFLGADKGGWDLTQVLRVPATTNYKYTSTPRVRVLWSDGPDYKLSDILKKLPDREEEEEYSSEEVLKLYREYEKSLPPWVRRELLNGKPSPGKRSEMMWKLVNSLIEAGVSRDDCFTLLRASPWNKFKGRDDQLRREIEKSTGTKLKSPKKREEEAEDNEGEYQFLTKSMAEVEEENTDWIWYPYLARSELSILEGDPGVGKSYLAQIISGSLVEGRRLPTIKKGQKVTQGKVAYFDLENSAGTVTKKRLTGNGFENLTDYFQDEQPFSIDDDNALEAVYRALERIRPTMVVFDTINTYIGKADTYKSSEAQQAFNEFIMIAKRFNCAVVVLRHLTKGGGSKGSPAIYRGQGSIAFTGGARMVLTVGRHPEDPETRVMAMTKNNLAPLPPAITYSIIKLPDTLKSQDRSRLKWGEFVDLTSDDILGVVVKQTEKEDAVDFLNTILAEGPVSVEKIQGVAESRSISWRTVQRSAETMGVVKRQRGFGKDKTSVWSLPEKAPANKKR